MKKALSVFLMLALVGSVFAAEPVADVNIAEFKGDASVQWGVNLDTGKTGFKNSASVTLKLNLLNEGSKSTTGDGVWGELVIKTNGDTFAKATNNSYIALPAMNVVVDKAQINFGPAYVGITNGDTQTGKLKMDAAVKSADSDNAVTLGDVGPADYTQGITIGYKHDMFNVAADVRSYNATVGIWRIDYTAPDLDYTDVADIKGKGPGSLYESEQGAKDAAKAVEDYYKSKGQSVSVSVTKVGTYNKVDDQYSHKYAMALEGEFTGVENLSVKAGVSYDFGTLQGESKGFDVNGDGVAEITMGKAATLGYSTSAGYKLALNDTFYVRPQVGFAGTSVFGEDILFFDTGSVTTMNMVTGVLFGWGDIGVDANPGVYYMDTDSYKKVSPGVGVVVNMPLVYSLSGKVGDNKTSADFYAGTARVNGEKQDLGLSLPRAITITPSFYSGEIIPGLTSAVYSNIGIATQKDVDTKVTFDIAAAAKYAIPVAAGTITPQVGVKYANANANKGTESLTTKIGVDVAGFVANTTFFTVYDSGNFLAKDKAGKSKPSYGTLNFGAKISF
ncbi:MAG: autotransporter [Spirochaetia bacterium]|nr:autotransporter [Spirochaetia bacterium]